MSAATVAAQVFRLPDLGEGLTEAEVVGWHVEVGDVVEVDQVVVEVETAKAMVEVPCPYAGRVETLHAAAGEVLLVGQPLITVSGEGSTDGSAAQTYREEERAGSGAVLIGYGTKEEPAGRRRRRPVTRATDDASQHAPSAPDVGAPQGPALVISPLVRRLARENGLDPREVPSSGPGGIVLRRDVESAIAERAQAGTRPVAATTTAGQDGETRIPLKGLRRAVADKLSQSRREIPDVSIWVDADATRLLEARAEINAAQSARGEQPVSVLALMARICVLGLRQFPQLNARVDVEREEIVQLPQVHLGIAAQTDRGLVVPVVRDAHAMTLRQLSAAIAGVVAQAREGTLSPAQLTGGTFTLNNYGVFGVDGSTPIINHPEAAIVGLGRITDKPWAVDGQLAVRKVTQLVLAFDHRVCDGGVAGGFARFVADAVESPVRLLADL